MKAFEVRLPKLFPDVVSVYASENPSKVRYLVFLNLLNANYTFRFGDILNGLQIKRLPKFDSEAEKRKETCSLGWHDKSFCYGVYGKEDIKEE